MTCLIKKKPNAIEQTKTKTFILFLIKNINIFFHFEFPIVIHKYCFAKTFNRELKNFCSDCQPEIKAFAQTDLIEIYGSHANSSMGFSPLYLFIHSARPFICPAPNRHCMAVGSDRLVYKDKDKGNLDLAQKLDYFYNLYKKSGLLGFNVFENK